MKTKVYFAVNQKYAVVSFHFRIDSSKKMPFNVCEIIISFLSNIIYFQLNHPTINISLTYNLDKMVSFYQRVNKQSPLIILKKYCSFYFEQIIYIYHTTI